MGVSRDADLVIAEWRVTRPEEEIPWRWLVILPEDLEMDVLAEYFVNLSKD